VPNEQFQQNSLRILQTLQSQTPLNSYIAWQSFLGSAGFELSGISARAAAAWDLYVKHLYFSVSPGAEFVTYQICISNIVKTRQR